MDSASHRYGVGQKPTFWIGPLADDENREVHIAFVAPTAAVRAFLRRGRRRRRGAPRAAGVARVPPGLLRRVRPRPRRQQRRSRLSRPGVTAADDLVRRARAVLDRNRRARRRARRRRCTRTSGCGTRASSPSGSPRYDPPRAAERAARAVPRPVGQRDAPAHDLRRRAEATSAAAASGSRRRHPARRVTSTHLHHAAAARRIAVRASSPTLLGRDDRRAFLAEMVPKLVAYHSWLLPRARPDGSRPRHADPPVGVRARHDPAVDARAAADADAVVAARRRRCGWPGSSARSATTRATCPRSSGRPTTTACACSRSPSIAKQTASTSRRIPRDAGGADRGRRRSTRADRRREP